MRKRLRKIFGTYKIETVQVVPYLSYGTSYRLYVKGRVLDNFPLQITPDHSFLQTLKNAFRQFDTHEISNVKLRLILGATELTTVSDRKGYFLFDAILPEDIQQLSDTEGWVGFTVKAETREEVFKGEFLIPEPEADYGVITDIDDTLLNTGVTSFLKWKLLFNSFFVNAYRRMPLEGAPNLYQKLHLGIENKEKNPVFYISNSPWNMYRYLSLFLEHNKFPKGPVVLRSFNSIFQKVAGDEKPHKQKEIFNILETYPGLKFILVGDSGEHDAAIYTEIAAQFPDRILCIYLRSVPHKRRMLHVKSIVDNFRTTPILMVETSAEAEAHARQNRYV
jgi:phosphatidate phosphatase APP1